MADFEKQTAAMEFYRRSQDELSRLYSRAELERQVRQGLIAPDELVQLEGAPIWQPVRVVIGEPPREEATESPDDGIPSWTALWEGLVLRLGLEFENPSPRVAAVFLGIGAVGMLASRLGWWLWLPWFVIVLIAAASMMRANRLLAGIAFALAALVVPFLLAPSRSGSPELEPTVTLPAGDLPPPAAPPSRVIVPAAPAANDAPPPVAPLPPASTPVPTATPVAAVPKPEESPAAAPATPDAFRSGALVIVRDARGAGSGFIAEQDGKRYLFTNAHVVAGMKQPAFTLLDGRRLTPVAIESAAGHDVIRFALKEEPAQAMEIATGIEQNVRLDDDVTVYGNSGGAGVVTSLPGKIVGIGPDRIEVSSPFIPGNSGSPIIHLPTGRVLGVATYLTKKHEEWGENGGPSDVIRRYGYRLDSVKRWEPVNWQAFQVDAERIEKISKLTEDIFNFLEAVQHKKEPVFATEALRKPAEDWRQTISRRQLSPADRRNATQSFLSNLRFMARSDVVAAESALRYSFFKEKLQKERAVRDELYKAFDNELGRISAPSLQGR